MPRKRSWPITVKVPVAVAALMMLVGFVLSERVLARLAETQERHLIDLSRSYLDGLSSAIEPSILREDNWEVFDAIARAQELNKSLRPAETIVTNAEGVVIAASDPPQHPIGSKVVSSADVVLNQNFSFDTGAATASAIRVLSYPGRTAGIIFATFDTSHLAAERRDVVIALVLTNGALTILLATAGWILVAWMMRPVRILSEHLGGVRETLAVPIPDQVVASTKGEFGRVFEGYNALVRSMKEREDLGKRLAEEKRLGSLGRLASIVAHEINNPLGGLFNAVSTLKMHGHLHGVRLSSLGLLERGLVGIRDVVRTTLTIYRTDATTPRDLAPADIDDLTMLVRPEARRKSVGVVVQNGLTEPAPISSTPVRQAVLNLILNAVAAAPEGSDVVVSARCVADQLEIVVSDGGCGLPAKEASILIGQSPPPLDGGGLGLWTISRLVGELGGSIDLDRPSSGGTVVTLMLPLSRRRPRLELSNVA